MSEFRAKDIGLRVQKKLASKISNKAVARTLLDDATSQILDNLYKLCKNVVSRLREHHLLKLFGHLMQETFDGL